MIDPVPSVEAVRDTAAPDGAHADEPTPSPIRSFRAAVAVLTRFPVADPGVRTGAPAFALVGALLGGASAVPIVVLGGAVPAIAAILAIAIMAGVSGAIHLDGLADTADALIAVGPDAAERARKDPAVGAAGAVTLILILGLDVAALTAVLTKTSPFVAALTCVIAASGARSVPPAVARLGMRSAAANGLAARFAARVTRADVAIALTTAAAIALGVAAVSGRGELLVAGVAGVAIGIGSSMALARLRHQVDGDLLGAGVELAQAGCLVGAAVLVSWPA